MKRSSGSKASKSVTQGWRLKDEDPFLRIYEIVRLIPRGRVTTYGHIAKCLGLSGGARLVGWAMNASHKQEKYVPAHRVVNRNGLLSGKMHFESPDAMQKSLESEGIRIVNDQVQDFQRLLWDPMDMAL